MKLSFVNKGEEFKLPTFSVEMQERLLEIMSKENTKKMSKEQENQLWNKYTVVLSLQEIDESVSIENINRMHPEDYIYLFKKIMSDGRELTGDDDKDFQETK